MTVRTETWDEFRHRVWVESLRNRPPEVATMLRKESEMPIIAKAPEGGQRAFKPVSAGLHPAVCVGVIDLGVQRGDETYPDPKPKVHLRWACTDEMIEWERDGVTYSGPAIIGKTFTVSLHERASLRKTLEPWRGRPFSEEELKGFDLRAVAGKPCQLQIAHRKRPDGKIIAEIQSIVSWPKGMPVPKTDPPLIYDCGEPDDLMFAQLPEWLRTLILGRLANTMAELTPTAASHTAAADTDDETVPF